MMQELHIDLPDAKATAQLGFELAKAAGGNLVVALKGPLGVGKTTLVKGAAQALAVQELVSSPTFTLINEYTTGQTPLYHLDLYRMPAALHASDHVNDAGLGMLELELDELLAAPGLMFIEWAEYLAAYIAQLDHVEVALNYLKLPGDPKHIDEQSAENGRTALVSGYGERASQIVADLRIVYFS